MVAITTSYVLSFATPYTFYNARFDVCHYIYHSTIFFNQSNNQGLCRQPSPQILLSALIFKQRNRNSDPKRSLHTGNWQKLLPALPPKSQP
jgi:hypothetical protein